MNLLIVDTIQQEFGETDVSLEQKIGEQLENINFNNRLLSVFVKISSIFANDVHVWTLSAMMTNI